MNTRLIMSSTAIFLAAIGIVLTFAPSIIIRFLGVDDSIALSLVLQLLGATYYALAIMNWMAKGAIIGGIYNRPIAMANLTHFLLGGIALTKVALGNHQLSLILLAGVYLIAACVFWYLIFRHPGTTAA